MDIDELNELCKGSLMELLGIRFTSVSDERVEAEMPIRSKLFQPGGSVHGGALIALAESVGSAGSFLSVDPKRYQVFGAVVHSQHLLPAREGALHAVAQLVHRGDYKHVWDVEITDHSGKLISISRVTNSVKPMER